MSPGWRELCGCFFWRVISHPATNARTTSRPAQRRKGRHLNRNLHLLLLDRQRHTSFSANFKTRRNSFANFLQSFFAVPTLGDTSGNGRTVGNPNPILILRQCRREPTSFRTAPMLFCKACRCAIALKWLGRRTSSSRCYPPPSPAHLARRRKERTLRSDVHRAHAPSAFRRKRPGA